MQTIWRAFLPLAVVVLAGCPGDKPDAIDAWVSARQAELPTTLGAFEWKELSVYENQVIAVYLPSDPRLQATGAPSDDMAFDAVTTAVCQVPDIDQVWRSGYEHYVSIETPAGEVVKTIRTKSFDCCVLQASKTMSREDAQNHCPYDEH